MQIDLSKLVRDIIQAYSGDILDENVSTSIAQTLNDYFDAGGDFSEFIQPQGLTNDELVFLAAILNQLIAFWQVRGKIAKAPAWLNNIRPFQEPHYLVPKKYRKIVQGRLSEACLQFNVIASKGFLTFA